MAKKQLDIPTKPIVIQKLKGFHLSLPNIQKLAYMKAKYNISESRIVEKALDEFFEKYE